MKKRCVLTTLPFLPLPTHMRQIICYLSYFSSFGDCLHNSWKYTYSFLIDISKLDSDMLIYLTFMLIYLTFITSFLLSFHIYILSFPFAKIVALINEMKLLCLVSYTFDNIFKPPIYRKVCQKLYPLLYHSWKFQVSPSLYILSCSYNQDFLFILQLILIFENKYIMTIPILFKLGLSH